jgi:hypothetical protein
MTSHLSCLVWEILLCELRGRGEYLAPRLAHLAVIEISKIGMER